jgi:hypothetical protein
MVAAAAPVIVGTLTDQAQGGRRPNGGAVGNRPPASVALQKNDLPDCAA